MKKSKLLLLAIVFIGFNVSAQLPTYVPSNGLVGWWPFTGNADDLGPNSYSTTATGVTSTIDRFGNPNAAYSFDGVNDQIVINGSNIGSGDFTISGWFKTSYVQTANTYKQLFMAGYNNSNKVTEMVISNWPSANTYNRLTANIRQTFPSDVLLDGPDSINDGTWKHFVIVKTSTKFKLYLNTVLIDSATHTASAVMETAVYTIGNGQGNVANRWFNGSIDDIGFWSRALSAQEITALSTAINTGLQPELKQNTFKIWPNPTNSSISINNGQYSALKNFKVKIYNSIGQEVFESNMSTEKLNADITDIGSKGLYILSIIDDQNNIVHTEKLLLN